MQTLIGQQFCAQGLATPEQIQQTLDIQAGLKTHRLLGHILIEREVISREQAQMCSYSQSCILLDLVARINSAMDNSTLLSTIMESAKVITDAEASSLMLLDGTTRELIVTLPTGPAGAEISGIRIPAGKGFGGWVVEHRRPLVVEDASKDARFFGDIAKSGFRTRSLLCVPLCNADGDVIGVLQAVNKRDGGIFTGKDIPVFMDLADQASIALEKARQHQLAMEKKLMEQQLELAHSIQTSLWPKRLPTYSGFEFAAISIPATHVGGDYYDFIPLGEYSCAVTIGDVCGKGVPAAILMAMLRAMLRAESENAQPIEESIRRINHVLVQDTPPGEFVTLFYGMLNTRTKELTYVNAGHNPPYLYDLHTDEIIALSGEGPVVGILDDYPFQADGIALRPGQVVVFYTDGVTESMNHSEEQFGDKHLKELIRENARQSAQTILDHIYAKIVQHVAGAPQHDDLTMVIMKISE